MQPHFTKDDGRALIATIGVASLLLAFSLWCVSKLFASSSRAHTKQMKLAALLGAAVLVADAKLVIRLPDYRKQIKLRMKRRLSEN